MKLNNLAIKSAVDAARERVSLVAREGMVSVYLDTDSGDRVAVRKYATVEDAPGYARAVVAAVAASGLGASRTNCNVAMYYGSCSPDGIERKVADILQSSINDTKRGA